MDKIPNVRLHKSGRYEARIVIQGKRWSAYGSTEADALDALEEKILRFSKPPKDQPQTFGSYWDNQFTMTLETKSLGHRRTIKWARTHVQALATLPIREIDRPTLQHYFNTKAKTLGNSIVHLRAAVHSVLALAVLDRLIEFNPAQGVQIKKTHASVEPLTAQELFRLIDQAQKTNPATLAPLVLGGLLGLGFGEIRGLTPQSFGVKGSLKVAGTKNKYRVRTLPLPPGALSLIADLKFPLIGSSDSSTVRNLQAVAARIKLEKPVNRNVLRHTCATGLQFLGCPEEVRAAILGHSKKSMTSHYSHDPMTKQMETYLNAWVEFCLVKRGVIDGVRGEGKSA